MNPEYSHPPLSDKGDSKKFFDEFGIHVDYGTDFGSDNSRTYKATIKNGIIYFDVETTEDKFNRIFNVEDAQIIKP